MFCDSGDARHVFITVLAMASKEIGTRKDVCKNVHITLVDLKPAAIARTLIFFDMMMTWCELHVRKVPGIEDLPIIMAYIFAGSVVPAAVIEKVQDHIEALLPAMETDEELFDWLYVPASTRKKVAHVLRQWQKPLDASYYRVPAVRHAVKNRLRREKLKARMVFGNLIPIV
jgi:hypothetical protein